MHKLGDNEALYDEYNLQQEPCVQLSADIKHEVFSSAPLLKIIFS